MVGRMDGGILPTIKWPIISVGRYPHPPPQQTNVDTCFPVRLESPHTKTFSLVAKEIVMSPTNRCYCPLVCAAVVLLGSVLPARSQDGQLSRQQQFAQDLLEELVEIDTTHSSGSTTMAAQGPAEKEPG